MAFFGSRTLHRVSFETYKWKEFFFLVKTRQDTVFTLFVCPHFVTQKYKCHIDVCVEKPCGVHNGTTVSMGDSFPYFPLVAVVQDRI